MADNEMAGSLNVDLMIDPQFDSEFFAEHFDAGFPTDCALRDIEGVGFLTLNKEFDSVAYLANNRDVLLANMHPVAHWMRYGRSEKRSFTRQGKPFDGFDERITLGQLARGMTTPLGAWPRTAFVIHIFYEEYVPWLTSLLKSVPSDVDIFVSSPKQDIIDNFKALAISNGLKHHIFHAISQNRGRNFGPMFVEFGRSLRNYEVIGHVHTKKSLYTGTPRYEWWLHAISGVLTGAQHVQAIRLLLAQTEKGIGLVCSAKLPELPFWAYHDLKNGPMLRELSALIGRKTEHDYGYSDYPVGGMFWASREVLAPLLARDWNYTDFPEEEGQTDGTMHHAIERMIGHLAADEGLRTLKWLPGEHVYGIQNAPWLADIQGSISQARALSTINSADTVSFDIFDTLLYRNVFDVDQARKAVDHQHPGYWKARVEAETKCRRNLGPHEDVRIADIAIGMTEISELSIGQAFELVAKEFEVDLSLMRKRHAVCELVEYARKQGKVIIYVSDMYLSASSIEKILDYLQIPRPDHLFVSSEVGLRKDRGDMWASIVTNGFGRLVHFGDNIVSDLQNATDNGVDSFYIPSILDKCDVLKILMNRRNRNDLEDLFLPIVTSYGTNPFFS